MLLVDYFELIWLTGRRVEREIRTAFLEHEQTEVISGAEWTNCQGYTIKTPYYIFLFTLDQKTVINDNTDISDTVATETGISAAVPFKPMLSASIVETHNAQHGKNQDGDSTLLLCWVCFELCVLVHDNKSDTARRNVVSWFFSPRKACWTMLKRWEKETKRICRNKFWRTSWVLCYAHLLASLPWQK